MPLSVVLRQVESMARMLPEMRKELACFRTHIAVFSTLLDEIQNRTEADLNIVAELLVSILDHMHRHISHCWTFVLDFYESVKFENLPPDVNSRLEQMTEAMMRFRKSCEVQMKRRHAKRLYGPSYSRSLALALPNVSAEHARAMLHRTSVALVPLQSRDLTQNFAVKHRLSAGSVNTARLFLLNGSLCDENVGCSPTITGGASNTSNTCSSQSASYPRQEEGPSHSPARPTQRQVRSLGRLRDAAAVGGSDQDSSRDSPPVPSSSDTSKKRSVSQRLSSKTSRSFYNNSRNVTSSKVVIASTAADNDPQCAAARRKTSEISNDDVSYAVVANKVGSKIGQKKIMRNSSEESAAVTPFKSSAKKSSLLQSRFLKEKFGSSRSTGQILPSTGSSSKRRVSLKVGNKVQSKLSREAILTSTVPSKRSKVSSKMSVSSLNSLFDSKHTKGRMSVSSMETRRSSRLSKQGSHSTCCSSASKCSAQDGAKWKQEPLVEIAPSVSGAVDCEPICDKKKLNQLSDVDDAVNTIRRKKCRR